MIQNKEYILKRTVADSNTPLAERIAQAIGHEALRWYITAVNDEKITVEATLFQEEAFAPSRSSVLEQHYPGKSAVLSLIPTGIACEFGGYAGDASPVTALLASCTDYLLTNPNAVNASNFIYLQNNLLYTEGYCIDLFCRGLTNLYIPYTNKIGLIIEKSDEQKLDIVFNILNTVRAIYGVHVEHYIITDAPIGGRAVQNKSGAFVGTIDNPATLFAACDRLLSQGVDAIAVTSTIQDMPATDYARHFSGQYPNPVGGAEAVISHLICHKYKVPAAHAPMINFNDFDLNDPIVDARGAGEIASTSGLACILIGLRQAPQIQDASHRPFRDIVNLNNLLAIVTPASCLGGIPSLYTRQRNIPIIAVQDNDTILNVTQSQLQLSHVVEVNNYLEAAGILMALQNGLSLPGLVRPLKTIKYARESCAPSLEPVPTRTEDALEHQLA